jgi:hypothetical protein
MGLVRIMELSKVCIITCDAELLVARTDNELHADSAGRGDLVCCDQGAVDVQLDSFSRCRLPMHSARAGHDCGGM